MAYLRPEYHQKLQTTRGDTSAWNGQVLDPENSNNPVPLGGCQLWWTVKKSNDDDDSGAIWQKTIGNGITVDNNGTGQFKLGPLAAADTKSLPNRVTGYVWDIQLEDLAGNVITVAKGTLLVLPETTDS